DELQTRNIPTNGPTHVRMDSSPQANKPTAIGPERAGVSTREGSGGRGAAGGGDGNVPGDCALVGAFDRSQVVERHRDHRDRLGRPRGGRIGAAGLAVSRSALVTGEIVVEERRRDDDGEVEKD